MLLALDTSSALAGVALHGDGGPTCSTTWRAERMHTVQLMPTIAELLRRAALRPTDLTALAVATGPGSYTGVRVGLASAKGMAAALSLPLIGVPTLLYTAWPRRREGLPVYACIELGRDRLGVAAYTRIGHSSLALQWLRNMSPREVVQLGPGVYCGELTDELRTLLREVPALVVPDASVAQRNPAVLAELAWERVLQGETDSPATLQAVMVADKPR